MKLKLQRYCGTMFFIRLSFKLIMQSHCFFCCKIIIFYFHLEKFFLLLFNKYKNENDKKILVFVVRVFICDLFQKARLRLYFFTF